MPVKGLDAPIAIAEVTYKKMCEQLTCKTFVVIRKAHQEDHIILILRQRIIRVPREQRLGFQYLQPLFSSSRRTPQAIVSGEKRAFRRRYSS